MFRHAQRKKVLALPLYVLGREKMLSMGEYLDTSLELARKKVLDARARNASALRADRPAQRRI